MGIQKYLQLPATFIILSCFATLVASKYVVRLRSDAQCPMAGYFRDETNCRRFYRCAEHPTGIPGQNFMTRAEFDCPLGTIFDEAVSSCNHIMFVQNIPPGCDVSGAMAGIPIGGSSTESIGSSTSEVPPSESTTSSPPVTMTSPPSSIQQGQPPQFPFMPPEHGQMVPKIPGAGDGQRHTHPLPPSIPMIPGGDQQHKPMFPSINLPGGQIQMPMFPSVNVPMLPGGQGKPPMIPIPSVPSGGQQHQSLLSSFFNLPLQNLDQHQQEAAVPSLPSFNLPPVSGSPQLPQLTFPSNFQFPGISTLPSGQLQLNNQQNLNPEQNLENIGSSSAITINAQNNGQSQNKPAEGGWVTPQPFPPQVVVKPIQQGGSASWVVPNDFPTFYSAFSGGSPVFLSSLASNPSSLVLI